MNKKKKIKILNIINIILIIIFFVSVYYLYYLDGYACPDVIGDIADNCYTEIINRLIWCYIIFILIEIVYFILFKLKLNKAILVTLSINLVWFIYLLIKYSYIIHIGKDVYGKSYLDIDLYGISHYSLIFMLPLINGIIYYYILKKSK